MKTLLFIRNNPIDGTYGGSLRTEEAYGALSRKYIVIDYFINKKRNKLLSFLRNLFLYSGNLSPFDSLKIIKIIKNDRNINIVFFDVSLHGRLAKKIRKLYPKIKIIMNFHNAERLYYQDVVRTNRLFYFPLLLAATYNERLSVLNSDLNIFITDEDRRAVNAYEVPSVIIPCTLTDKYISCNDRVINGMDNYILFVGIATSINLHGIHLLINEVAPHVSCKIIIVGKGIYSALRGKNIPLNVVINDYVEDLSELFINAAAFIAPLFYGAGMKIKIAEAMMYGKKIIATSRAFVGYNIDNTSCIVCDKSEDFVKEINNLNMLKKYYKESRQLFLDYYSSSNNDLYYSQLDELIE
ncbi:MAG: glycosyltransferase family 4 protein [Bacteroidales bacterium]|jgi:glycosyltransferase involved in cell wall biosynthesis|nr:glycosyltransferase family 4 protein [Bacteroidales bacterium]